jgi:hypothetical protein
VTTTAPERELIRRVLPFALPALVIAYASGALVSVDVAWSATIGVGVVLANFVIHALSMAWAAGVSPVALVAVGLGGFAVRLAAIFVALLLLDRLAWFSPVAFVGAVVPATVALVVFEAKVVSGRRLQADLWSFPTGSTEVER